MAASKILTLKSDHAKVLELQFPTQSNPIIDTDWDQLLLDQKCIQMKGKSNRQMQSFLGELKALLASISIDLSIEILKDEIDPYVIQVLRSLRNPKYIKAFYREIPSISFFESILISIFMCKNLDLPILLTLSRFEQNQVGETILKGREQIVYRCKDNKSFKIENKNNIDGDLPLWGLQCYSVLKTGGKKNEIDETSFYLESNCEKFFQKFKNQFDIEKYLLACSVQHTQFQKKNLQQDFDGILRELFFDLQDYSEKNFIALETLILKDKVENISSTISFSGKHCQISTLNIMKKILNQNEEDSQKLFDFMQFEVVNLPKLGIYQVVYPILCCKKLVFDRESSSFFTAFIDSDLPYKQFDYNFDSLQVEKICLNLNLHTTHAETESHLKNPQALSSDEKLKFYLMPRLALSLELNVEKECLQINLTQILAAYKISLCISQQYQNSKIQNFSVALKNIKWREDKIGFKITKFPFLSLDAIKFLIEKQFKCIAINTPSFDGKAVGNNSPLISTQPFLKEKENLIIEFSDFSNIEQWAYIVDIGIYPVDSDAFPIAFKAKRIIKGELNFNRLNNIN